MIKRFYRKIFVAIVQDGGKYDVRITAFKSKKPLYKESRTFEGASSLEDIHRYVRKYLEESPLHYVTLLNPALKQGALSRCRHHSDDEIEEISGAKTVCQDGEWLVYSSSRELESVQSQYKKIGLDFIFSPFSLLEYFFKDKIHSGFGLYALAQKDSFSVALFEDGKLEYAHHYPMQEKNTLLIEEEIGNAVGFSVGIKEEDEVEKGISLDDIESLDDLDVLEELDDLSDIEDLDNLEEIAEFSEDIPVFEEKRNAPRGSEIKQEMDKFNSDYHRFELIQRTLTHFYAGEHCHNRFVETVYIADAYGSGAELKRYLEEELFLNVLVRHIELADELLTLAVAEEEGR